MDRGKHIKQYKNQQVCIVCALSCVRCAVRGVRSAVCCVQCAVCSVCAVCAVCHICLLLIAVALTGCGCAVQSKFVPRGGGKAVSAVRTFQESKPAFQPWNWRPSHDNTFTTRCASNL